VPALLAKKSAEAQNSVQALADSGAEHEEVKSKAGSLDVEDLMASASKAQTDAKKAAGKAAQAKADALAADKAAQAVKDSADAKATAAESDAVALRNTAEEAAAKADDYAQRASGAATEDSNQKDTLTQEKEALQAAKDAAADAKDAAEQAAAEQSKQEDVVSAASKESEDRSKAAAVSTTAAEAETKKASLAKANADKALNSMKAVTNAADQVQGPERKHIGSLKVTSVTFETDEEEEEEAGNVVSLRFRSRADPLATGIGTPQTAKKVQVIGSYQVAGSSEDLGFDIAVPDIPGKGYFHFNDTSNEVIACDFVAEVLLKISRTVVKFGSTGHESATLTFDDSAWKSFNKAFKAHGITEAALYPSETSGLHTEFLSEDVSVSEGKDANIECHTMRGDVTFGEAPSGGAAFDVDIVFGTPIREMSCKPGNGPAEKWPDGIYECKGCKALTFSEEGDACISCGQGGEPVKGHMACQCKPGSGYAKGSKICHTCEAPYFSKDGKTCELCDEGGKRSKDGTKCNCVDGFAESTSGKCEKNGEDEQEESESGDAMALEPGEGSINEGEQKPTLDDIGDLPEGVTSDSLKESIASGKLPEGVTLPEGVDIRSLQESMGSSGQ